MKTIIKIIASAAIAVGAGVVLSGHDDVSDNLIVCTAACIGIMVAAIMGVFDWPAKREDIKHDSIRKAERNYGQAAVFIGTACIFMGTPQECEDVCDDLWHYGQQAEVKMLSGSETLDVL